jgi:uncharacterized membrane protein YeaQ/YmgE (transglycosylase-associated protein family)
MLFFLLSSTRNKNPFKTILAILFIYEIIEILVIYFSLGIVRPETFKDQFTDIVVGMVGSFAGYYLLSKFSLHNPVKAKRLKFIIMIFTGLTYSFLWVGFYGYHYNVSFFNSPGINWYAGTLWFFASVIIIYSYEHIPIWHRFIRLVFVWVSYILVLFFMEAIGYYWFDLREVSNPDAVPLIFGIIHGTPVMHVVYIFAPLLILSLHFLLDSIILKPFQQQKQFSVFLSDGIIHLTQFLRKRILTNK